jgi:hypothetical protein
MRKDVRRHTQPALVDLFRCEGKHAQHFDHYLNYRFCHRRKGLDLRIDLESSCEILDAFKDVDEGIITFPRVLGRLTQVDIITSQLEGAR